MADVAMRARDELEPPWDDVREARVLSRVLEGASLPDHRTPAHRAKLIAGAVAVAAAAAVVGVWLRPPPRGISRPESSLPSAAAPSSTHAEAGSVLALADGSKAYLKPGAELETLTQSVALVRLVQTRGEVRYEVKPDSARPFTIQIRDVEVRVIGTLFTVTAEPGSVRVAVERGRVSVKSGARQVELAPGESVRLGSADVAKDALPAPHPQPAPESATAAPAPTAAADSPAQLVEAADAARARGDLPAAEHALRQVLALHPSSPQATSAAFTLGRIQRARGEFAAAARTFESLRQHAPAGPLAEDALAEAANAWALAGQSGDARSLADQYLARYPRGPHAERMRRLSQP